MIGYRSKTFGFLSRKSKISKAKMLVAFSLDFTVSKPFTKCIWIFQV